MARSAGSFSATVTSEAGDTNKSNNTVTAQLAVTTERGVDLIAFAEDVVAGRDDETGEVKRVPPGGTAKLYFGVGNAGSLAADGISITFAIPQDVTLVTVPAECSVNVRIVTCDLPDLVLEANEFLEGELA